MSPIVLTHQTPTGEFLQATFLPDKGMNLISFKRGDIEVIDQSTTHLFEERYAGLGALIGPHFHRRKTDVLPKIKEEALFPHIARVKSKGIEDPFSHGIARYAPWKAESTKDQIKALLNGKDTWKGVPLSMLEGQNFNMRLEVSLKENGLFLALSIVSDTASLVGIHYYYALSEGKGSIVSQVQNRLLSNRQLISMPSDWKFNAQQELTFDLNNEADFTFRPYPNPLQGEILLTTGQYKLRTRYTSDCGENCWQLYHPKGASFVCIEPISSQDPVHPNLTVSCLNIHLEILPHNSSDRRC
ncbi:MAG: hypothetical protein ACH350_05280 [Parachlamydiaceae bacterium]